MTWSSSTLQQPEWSAECLPAENLLNAGTQLDLAQFSYADAQTLTLAAGAITSGSNKTLTLTTALTDDLPAGTILNFGSGKYATLTTKGAKGATTIAGVTLAANIAGGETTAYKGVSGHVVVPSGTLVGRTYTERDAGTGFGVAAVADDEIYIVAFQVERGEIDAGVTLVRHQTLIYEDKLPGWAGFDTDTKAKVRSLYQCIKHSGV